MIVEGHFSHAPCSQRLFAWMMTDKKEWQKISSQDEAGGVKSFWENTCEINGRRARNRSRGEGRRHREGHTQVAPSHLRLGRRWRHRRIRHVERGVCFMRREIGELQKQHARHPRTSHPRGTLGDDGGCEDIVGRGDARTQKNKISDTLKHCGNPSFV